MKIKIAIHLPVWKRSNVLTACLMQLEHLIKTKSYKYSFTTHFVTSLEDPEIESINKLIDSFSGKKNIITTANSPLGAKNNAAFEAIHKTKFDYLLQIGSDDLLHPDLLTLYEPYMNKPCIIGIDSCYYFANHQKIIRFKYPENKTRAIGAGRLIHYECINTVLTAGQKIQTDSKNRGLDADSLKTFKGYGFDEIVLSTDLPYVIDIKSGVNINTFADILPHCDEKYDISILKNYYNTQILDYIYNGFEPKKRLKMEKVRCFDTVTKQERIYFLNIETKKAIQTGLLKVIEYMPEQKELETHEPIERIKRKKNR